MSFYTNPWGPTSSSLLVGDTTYNGFGAFDTAAPAVTSATPSGTSAIGAFGTGMQLFGALSGAIGSFYSAKSQQSALQFQAEMSEINARIAELGAQSALSAGQNESARLTLRYGQMKGAQRAALAANGVDLGVGNAAEIQASSELLKEIDKNTIEANAVRSAWGYRTQSVSMQNDAIARRATASSISPFMSGATSLLGSAGTVAQSWYRDRQSAAIADRLGLSRG